MGVSTFAALNKDTLGPDGELTGGKFTYWLQEMLVKDSLPEDDNLFQVNTALENPTFKKTHRLANEDGSQVGIGKDGKFGIGTENPSQIVEIQGDTPRVLISSGEEDPKLTLMAKNSDTGNVSYDNSAQNIVFQKENTESLTIDADGVANTEYQVLENGVTVVKASQKCEPGFFVRGFDDQGGIQCGNSADVLNGKCGSAVSITRYEIPESNLCSDGVLAWSNDTGANDEWGWTCNGLNGGTNEECSVAKKIDGGWSEESTGEYSACENGVKTRTVSRSCTNPAPQNGGEECSGDATREESVSCSVPIDGGWSDWSLGSAGSCSSSCGAGTITQKKYRTCTNPSPQNGGAGCSGSSEAVHSTTACSNVGACSWTLASTTAGDLVGRTSSDGADCSGANYGSALSGTCDTTSRKLYIYGAHVENETYCYATTKEYACR